MLGCCGSGSLDSNLGCRFDLSSLWSSFNYSSTGKFDVSYMRDVRLGAPWEEAGVGVPGFQVVGELRVASPSPETLSQPSLP